jgi:hypothetical protein
MKKIEVRPIKVTKWHGVDDSVDFTRPKTISVLVDGTTRKWATGLDAKDLEYLKDRGFGEDISDMYIPGSNKSYWNTKPSRIKLPNTAIFLDPSLPHEYIKIKNLKASKFVANSMSEYNKGEWPEAHHVIYDEAEGVEKKANKASKRKKAYAILAKLKRADIVNIIKLVENKNLGDLSDDFIDAAIDDLITEKLDKFLEYSEMTKKDLATRALVSDCLERNILNKKGAAVFYMGDQLGYSVPEVSTYLNDPKNQELKIRLTQKLKDSY